MFRNRGQASCLALLLSGGSKSGELAIQQACMATDEGLSIGCATILPLPSMRGKGGAGVGSYYFSQQFSDCLKPSLSVEAPGGGDLRKRVCQLKAKLLTQ